MSGWMGNLTDKMDIANTKMFKSEDVRDIDVAVVKATLNDEVVPKEKHVRTLKVASALSAPRQQVSYVIHGLGMRLDDHKANWLVTLKALIVFHRLFREVDPSFQEEMLRYGERTTHRRMLRLDGFADHTTKETWDISAWIRVYSVYLDERLEVFRVMHFDPEQDDADDSKLKACSTPDLLERLPLAHKLLARLIACVPQGAASGNVIVVQACGLVLKEVRAVYKLVCEGVMNLADKFFEMERNDAIRGLELYKENVALNERLNGFFNAINNVGSMRGSVQFPTLQALPTDFVTTLEEYVKEAPKVIDPTAPGSGRKGQGPPANTRTSTVARQGGITSDAISGEGGVISVPGGMLKLGGPAGAEAGTAAATTAMPASTEVDLLGGDLLSVSINPSVQPDASSPAAAAPSGLAASENSFFGGSWMANQSPTPPSAAAAAPPASHADANPFGQPAFGGPTPAPAAAAAMPPAASLSGYPGPQYGMPPAAAAVLQGQNPFQPFGAPAAAAMPPAPAAYPQPGYMPQATGAPPNNPFGNAAFPPPAAAAAFPPAPAANNPFGGYSAPPLAPSPPMYSAVPPPYGGTPPAANPFGGKPFPPTSAGVQLPGGGGNPFGAPAGFPSPPAPVAWSTKDDPLGDLSIQSLEGKPQQQPPKQSLKQLRGGP
ncbi:hypothetical protein CEUSTIGMA_g4120.t1 [Chlamydomonas eustigma]|uniref:ENTH domain-containing protein n=1 Tax=Chlamydomonas eustigma TaxID=1157962 RepID=A0A250X0P8_9CHLO|nr:hypothetical protein CEUSTIGMA_g4120.t1 [Chlamydomonas eustigma]|eukprot:GAX76674.1 hypothetical protein CEUSTIGMA_g4120.t1 [Chlamydomonas eustigma]